jgi:protein-L-isoaspartate(D-aspartate) O-methyltransferase
MSKPKTAVCICQILIGLTLYMGCNMGNKNATDNATPSSYFSERKRMVQYQIRARGIDDKKVIDALLRVERHRFVPDKYIPHAYEDRPLPIGEGQTISQPYIVAFMTHVLSLSRTDKVLEIGTGSGYQAAILGEMCDNVFTIEVIPSLGRKAESLLKELGYKNVRVKIGDGYEGWKEYAPYDAIIVTCAPTHVPEPLKEQLKEGGRMVIPVGEVFDQTLVLFRKTGDRLKEEKRLAVRFVPMVNETGEIY